MYTKISEIYQSKYLLNKNIIFRPNSTLESISNVHTMDVNQLQFVATASLAVIEEEILRSCKLIRIEFLCDSKFLLFYYFSHFGHLNFLCGKIYRSLR